MIYLFIFIFIFFLVVLGVHPVYLSLPILMTWEKYFSITVDLCYCKSDDDDYG